MVSPSWRAVTLAPSCHSRLCPTLFVLPHFVLQGHWQLVHDVLGELRHLPAGPYMLRLDRDALCLEVFGVSTLPGPG
jgi:hypothetical protein